MAQNSTQILLRWTGCCPIMRDSLRLEVDEQTHSEYTGGYDGRDMYEDRKTVKVTLWADIDEESYKIDEIDFEA
ncbi:hypothetical protein RB43ORF129c [Escherichia phage RB43]|uniref:Uncharacterized protein n=1 Tax=Escherichia phage RB43 TaxID=2887182 RepID=Q56BR9_9CAUD|nr:hypothetical protein RB43ORF129c [Escherichia phage RB43]AAX78651.1 hypothetical protein RB43ORF129c [Escherichia phage RB43]